MYYADIYYADMYASITRAADSHLILISNFNLLTHNFNLIRDLIIYLITNFDPQDKFEL
jgi:hypothetical protein